MYTSSPPSPFALAIAFASLAIFAAATFAQVPQPLGGTFPVNSTTAQNQSQPEIATDFDGAFVAVWTSAGQDGSGTGVYAQFFDEDGDETGAELRVNVTTAGDQSDPAVSMGDDEDFAVAWVGPDADGTGIFLRIFDEGGATTLTDIPVNTTTAGQQSNPDVAFAEDGQVLVVWQSPDLSGEGVLGRFFNSAGLPLSAEFALPTSTAGDQTEPTAADVDEDGSFVVAWEGGDAQGRGIFAQRLADDATLLGGEISVNTTTAGDQTQPSIGVRTNDDALLDNGFVITWQGPDGDGSGIFAQFFAEDGMAVDGEIRINPEAAGNQFDPDVSIDDEGDYVVTWSEDIPTLERAQRGSPILIRGRRLIRSSRGLGPGDPFTIASGSFQSSAVAAEANGDFVAVWQTANDGGGSGVLGQRYGLNVIFGDGFESGNTTAWSTAVP